MVTVSWGLHQCSEPERDRGNEPTSGASQGGNDTFGLETYQRGRSSPSNPALRSGLTLEAQERYYDFPDEGRRGLGT